MVPDENSMEDPLCNSAIGSMVSLDYVTPDTYALHRPHMSGKGIVGSQPRCNQIVFSLTSREDPKCEVCEKNITTRDSCRVKLEQRG